jgi:thiamine biosynthesis lipoprotein
MGTEVSVTVWHDDESAARQAIDAVMEDMRQLDEWWNPANPAGELYWVNQQAGAGPVAISPELAQVIAKALYFSELTGGAFDISFASVGRYYDYRESRAPHAEQREAALQAVDYRLIELDTKALRLHFGHPLLKIDLGGIAKGYAVDRALAILAGRGIAHASVSAGGDTGLLGDRRGRPWMVGIRNPRKEGDVALTLPLESLAFSTSGDYERYFIDPDSGERIHHIINPRTGKSTSGVISASVMGPRGFDTDPLSTTVFVLGVDKGLALINSLPEFDAVLIDDKGVVHYSSGLEP